MDATYSWHPGAAIGKSRWPVPMCMMPDELISSWLVRLSFAQGCDPLLLTESVWPKSRVWTRDLDRGLSALQITRLSVLAGVIPENIEAAGLRQIALKICMPGLGANGVWPWILAVGIKNRRRSGGLQFCPMCLQTDDKPFYRIQWRLAWHTVCARHRILLLDRCPSCGSAIQPHRLTPDKQNIAWCHSCNFDLRESQVSHQLPDSLMFQNMADKVTQAGVGAWGNKTITAPQWFAFTRYLITILRKGTRLRHTRLDRFLMLLGANLEEISGGATSRRFEFLSLKERADLLSFPFSVCEMGIEGFLKATQAAELGLSYLINSHQELPDVLREFISYSPKREKVFRKRTSKNALRPKPKDTVMRQWLRLQRQKKLET